MSPWEHYEELRRGTQEHCRPRAADLGRGRVRRPGLGEPVAAARPEASPPPTSFKPMGAAEFLAAPCHRPLDPTSPMSATCEPVIL